MGARALLASSQPASGETTTATTVAPASGGGGPEEAMMTRRSSAEEGLERIPWKEDGYLSWEYEGHKINYVDEGDKDKVLLAGERSFLEFDPSGRFGTMVCGRSSREMCTIWFACRDCGLWRRLRLMVLVGHGAGWCFFQSRLLRLFEAGSVKSRHRMSGKETANTRASTWMHWKKTRSHA